MNKKCRMYLALALGVLGSTNVLGAAMSSDLMAATVLVDGPQPKHRIWATTTSGQLSGFKETDGTWRIFKSNVRGGVAAIATSVGGDVQERVFVPSINGVADVTVQNDIVTQERELRTTAGDQFLGSDVGVLTTADGLLVSSISSTGKLCIWAGRRQEALSNVYCSQAGLADPQSAIAEEPLGHQVFYFRAQNKTLHAASVSRSFFRGYPFYLVYDNEIGTPGNSTEIGPSIVILSAPDLANRELVVTADNAVWLARYDVPTMSVRWTNLGSPPSSPGTSRSALSMMGGRYFHHAQHPDGRIFPLITCNMSLYTIGFGGRLYVKGGNKTVSAGENCGTISLDSPWVTMESPGWGYMSSFIPVAAHESEFLVLKAGYGVNHYYSFWPPRPNNGYLMRYDENGWTNFGNP